MSLFYYQIVKINMDFFQNLQAAVRSRIQEEEKTFLLYCLASTEFFYIWFAKTV